jgi:hypothetical protein
MTKNLTTTYILCGGDDRKYDAFGENLVKVITDIVPKPRILDAMARPREDRPEQLAEWTEWYGRYFRDFSNELAEPEDFFAQVERADVVFFHGGRNKILLEDYPDFAKVKNALRGKIFVGSSAGANYISSHCLRQNGELIGASGILPINVIVHYESDDAKERRSQSDVEKMARRHPEFPTIALREGEFTIFVGAG